MIKIKNKNVLLKRISKSYLDDSLVKVSPLSRKFDIFDVTRISSKNSKHHVLIERIKCRDFQGLVFILNSDNEI